MRNERFFITFILGLIVAIFVMFPHGTRAATRTWDGGGADNNWSTAENWSADTVPLSTDTVTFDSTSVKDSTVDSGFAGTVTTWNINSGYTGTTTLATTATTTTLTFGAGATSTLVLNGNKLAVNGTFTINAGTFTGDTGWLDINDGNFSQTDGTFTVPTTRFTVERNFTVTAGTFSSTGTTTFDGTNDFSMITYPGTLPGITVIDKNGSLGHSGSLNIVATSTTLNLGTNPTIGINTTSTEINLDNRGTLLMAGSVTVNGCNTCILYNTGTITHSGTYWDINASFTNNGGTITYSGTAITVTNNFTQIGGTFDLTGYTITFDGANKAGIVTVPSNSGWTAVITKTASLGGGTSLTVASGTTIDLGTNPTVTLTTTSGASNLINRGTILLAGTLTCNGGGAIRNYGIITHSGSGWDINDSALVNEVGGTITYSGTAITVERSFQQAGTFDLVGKTLTFDGTSDVSVLSASSTLTGANVVVNKTSTGTFTIMGDVTVDGTFLRTDGATGNPSSAYTLTVTGSSTITTSDAFAQNNLNFTTGTLQLTSSASITTASTTTYTITGSSTVPSLIVNSGTTFNNNGTLSLGGTSFTRNGTWTNYGTTTYTGLSGDDAVTLATTTYSKLTINNSGTVFSVATNTQATSTLTITGGILDLGSWNLDTTGATYSNSDILRLVGSQTFTGFTNDTDSGTTTYNGTGTYSSLVAGANYYNLGFEGTGTYSLSTPAYASSSITISSGTLDVTASNYGLVLDGNFSVAGGATFTARSATTTFSSASAQSASSTNFYNLYHSGAGTLTILGTTTASGDLTNGAGTFDTNNRPVTASAIAFLTGGTYLARNATQTFGQLVVSGATLTGSSGALDINGNVTLSSGTFTAPSGALTVSGNWTKSGGTFTPGSGTTTFDGSGTQTVTPDGTAFYNLAYDGSGTLTPTANLNASSSITISSGTLDVTASNYGLTLDSNFSVAGGATFTARSGTTTFSSASAQSASSTNFYNLYHSGAGTLTVNGTTTVSGNLTNDATVTRITGALTLSGTSTNTGTIIQSGSGRIIKPATSITLNKSSYLTGTDASIVITLVDNDENTVGTSTDTTTITLTDGTDTETVTLTETGNATYTFTGTTTLTQASATVGDDILQVSAAGTITASYIDNEDQTDNLQSTTATVSIPAVVVATESSGSGGGGGIAGMYGVINQNSQPFVLIPAATSLSLIDFIPNLPTPSEVGESIANFVENLFEPEVHVKEEEIKKIPLVFAGLWSLLNPEPINAFAFAPLPRSLTLLGDQFPEFKSTFERLGVTRLADLDKLLGSNFVLPRIENIKDMPDEVILAFQSLPAENLPSARFLSLASFLDISEKGTISQRVNAISGQKLTFAVRPEHKASSVRGYLVLKESRFSEASGNKFSLPLSSLAASIILSKESRGKIVDNISEIEEHLLLDKFVYQDQDGDGVYTAEIQAPLVASDFEVITVIDYYNPKFNNKELRFSLVVDPEGYVYANVNGGQLRIEKARISIFSKDTQSRFILWPGEEFQQRNPQTTGTTGEYSFLVPPGEYYMSVEASGYKTYIGQPFTVAEGTGVHENIELELTSGIWGTLGWPWLIVVLMLLAVIILLAYNFYKDKQRTRN